MAARLVGRNLAQRHVIVTQHRIRIVGKTVQRLDLGHRIGNGLDILGRLFSRAIVLVKAAAVLDRGAGFLTSTLGVGAGDTAPAGLSLRSTTGRSACVPQAARNSGGSNSK